ncbi:nucleotidyl transferase AbiEii/AbiGii toxin family protein [Edaphobacter sp.]|uniref:nucleotidyl transferase AbiEii/AbiGii toxin family protein n=1 Tax=Edaphobacter sp. TaxID=1934404 RepID=UPI0039C86DCC
MILRTKEIENAKKSILIGQSRRLGDESETIAKANDFLPKTQHSSSSQRTLWKELKATPNHFVLYGGTALAFRLGHRISEDFDFFTNESFEAQNLLERIP